MDTTNQSLEVIRLCKEILSSFKHSMRSGFENIGLTAPQGMLIGILSRYGKMKVSDLSDKLGLSNSTVSGIIDRLENQSMVVRERSKDDKRVVYVSLCPEFEQLHRGLHSRIVDNVTSMISKGTPEEIDKVIDGLNILKELLVDHKK